MILIMINIHMSIIIRLNYRKQYKIFKMILFKINFSTIYILYFLYQNFLYQNKFLHITFFFFLIISLNKTFQIILK